MFQKPLIFFLYLIICKINCSENNCRDKVCNLLLWLILCTGMFFKLNRFFLDEFGCKICLETCLELVRNELLFPTTRTVFPSLVLLGLQSVVYTKQGPRSGIFSVYILRNVDYILLTYSCPRLCVQFFLIVKQKSCDLLALLNFHSKLCLMEMCVRYVCVVQQTAWGLKVGFTPWSTSLWADKT